MSKPNVRTILLSVICSGILSLSAQAQEPGIHDTVKFLKKHFTLHASAYYQSESACANKCGNGPCNSTLSYETSTGIMTIRMECNNTDIPGGKTWEGGVFRFDPTAMTGSGCAQAEGSTKPVIDFYISSSITGAPNRLITVLEDQRIDPEAGNVEWRIAAWFTDLAQCERANTAFAHLRTFESEDPF